MLLKKWIVLFFCVGQLGFGASSDQAYWETQKEEFLEKGYVWIKHFYSPEQVLLLRNWAETIDEDALSLLSISNMTGVSLQTLAQNIAGALIVVPEASDPSKICRAEDLLTCYPDLYWFTSGTLATYLGKMLQEPYVLFKDKINFKWPGGGAFAPHQDFPAFEFFGPREHVTAMVCIDSATVENGCLYIAQNWKESLKNDFPVENGDFVLPFEEGGKNHGSILPRVCEKILWLPIIGEPGDVVFFDSFVPHYSEKNQSSAPRRALFLTHNRLKEGEHREAYYRAKRADPDNPMFHFGTPTKARNK